MQERPPGDEPDNGYRDDANPDGANPDGGSPPEAGPGDDGTPTPAANDGGTGGAPDAGNAEPGHDEEPADGVQPEGDITRPAADAPVEQPADAGGDETAKMGGDETGDMGGDETAEIAAAHGDQLDQTRQFPAVPRDDQTDPDATRVGPPLDLDATQQHPAVGSGPMTPESGATQPGATQPGTTQPGAPGSAPDDTQTFDADATRYVPTVGDPTRAMGPSTQRPLDETAVAPPMAEGWHGRAAVRPPGPVPATAPGGPPDEQGPGRTWWLPIVLGILGLLLIVGLAYGLVVATRHHASNPTPSPTPTSTPTTVAPSTPPTTPSAPPSTAPAAVTVPGDLTSLSLQDAENELSQLGLGFRAEPQTVSDPAQVGKVLSANPTPGSQVAPGTQVVLTYGVAAPPPSSAPPSPPSAAPSPSSS